ncbi:acyl-CoA carboxylase epsilon subunit [Actinophytocola sp.]|uniref:acyl-CoA carboxylase epsilon subunit n=1 Tax=Actinophytocola sp. TaxID=1872138 RepID=UPI0039C878A4
MTGALFRVDRGVPDEYELAALTVALLIRLATARRSPCARRAAPWRRPDFADPRTWRTPRPRITKETHDRDPGRPRRATVRASVVARPRRDHPAL